MGGFSGKKSGTTATKLSGIQVQSSVYGRCIPSVFGTARVNPNLIWYNDFKAIAQTSKTKSGGKGGGGQTNTTYTYQAALMLALCSGPIAGVRKVYKDKSIFIDGGTTALQQAGLSLALGTESQTTWPYLTTYHADQALPYAGLAYVYAPAYALGDSANITNHGFEVVSTIKAAGRDDCAPADIINGVLGSLPFWQSGLMADLTNYRDFCIASGFWFSLAQQEQIAANELLGNILKASNSEAVWTGGQFKIVPYGDTVITKDGTTWTPDLAPIYDIDDSITNDGGDEDPIPYSRTREADYFNQIQIDYLDRTRDYADANVPAEDPAGIADYGLRKASAEDFKFICDKDVATAVAQSLIGRFATIRRKFEIDLPPQYCLLEPMDLITITREELELDRALVRILDISENEEGDISALVEEVLVGAAAAAIVQRQIIDGYKPNFDADSGNATAPIFLKPPRRMTEGDLEMWIATSGGANWGGAEIWASLDGTSYERKGQIAGPARYGVTTTALAIGADPHNASLGVNILASGGTIDPATQAEFDAGVTLCMINEEIIAYRDATLTAAGQYTLGWLRRGLFGTTIAAHAIGSPFVRLDAAVTSLPFLQSDLGRTIYVKLRSYNAYGRRYQDLASLTAYSCTLGLTGAVYFGEDTTQVLARVNDMANDGLLDIQEKKEKLALDWPAIVTENSGILATATSLGVSTTAFAAAYLALTNYINALSPAWNNYSLDTTIVRADYVAAFKGYYDARKALANACDEKAAQTSNADTTPYIKTWSQYFTLGAGALDLPSNLITGISSANSYGGPKALIPYKADQILEVTSKIEIISFGSSTISYVAQLSAQFDKDGGFIDYQGIGSPAINANGVGVYSLKLRYGPTSISGSWIYDAPSRTYSYSGIIGLVYSPQNVKFLAQVVASDAKPVTFKLLGLQWADVTGLYAAEKAILDIGADGILSKDEKPYVVQEFNKALADYTPTMAAAASLGISSSAYVTAYVALYNYLVGLSPAYNDYTQNTNIVRATYNTRFVDYYNAKRDLDFAINSRLGKRQTLGLETINAGFDDWPIAANNPEVWSYWGNQTGVFSRVDDGQGGFAARITSMAGDTYCGWVQGVQNAKPNSYIVFEGKCKLLAGTFVNSTQFYLNAYNAAVNAASAYQIVLRNQKNADGTLINDGVVGQVYEFSKTIKLDATYYGMQPFCMNYYDVAAEGSTNQIEWHKCGWRYATDQEIRAYNMEDGATANKLFIQSTAPVGTFNVGDAWRNNVTNEYWVRNNGNTDWVLGADVTLSAVPSISTNVQVVDVQCDWQGNPLSGQLPKTVNFTRKKGNVDVSSTTTWSNGNTPSATVSFDANGILTISAISGSTPFVGRSVRDGVTLDASIQINKILAAPPNLGGGGTTVSDSSFTDISTTSMVAISNELTVKTGAAGAIDFSADLGFTFEAVSANGDTHIYLVWEYKAVGGSFAYLPSGTLSSDEVISTDPASDGSHSFDWEISENGSITYTASKTGLSANTDYVVRLMGRRDNTSPAGSAWCFGTAIAQGT